MTFFYIYIHPPNSNFSIEIEYIMKSSARMLLMCKSVDPPPHTHPHKTLEGVKHFRPKSQVMWIGFFFTMGLTACPC